MNFLLPSKLAGFKPRSSALQADTMTTAPRRQWNTCMYFWRMSFKKFPKTLVDQFLGSVNQSLKNYSLSFADKTTGVSSIWQICT
jgi:hypothetical protein